MTGARLTALTQSVARTITADTAVRMDGAMHYTNTQLWPYSSGIAHVWDTSWGPQLPTPTIAIVDSGVDASRADFGGRVVDQETFTSLTPNSPGDGRGHGTLAASIAAGGAAGHVGAAPTARIVSLDVMNDEGRALTSDVVAALDWIYANKDQYDIRVANLSLQATAPTSLRYDPIDKEVEKLWLSGVVVVSAAGNYAVDGARSDVRFGPANDPFGIAVGAVDLAGTVPAADDFAAPWSAYGHTLDGFSKPDLAAPGRAIVAAVPPDSTLVAQYPDRVTAPGYMWMSGTSFAAPVVSGVAADLLAAHPDWTPDQVKGALMLSARATAAAPGSVGVGEVDAAAATAVTAPPNPNKALEHFVVTDPTGATGPVFDAEAWGTAAAADPAWAAEAWGTEAWGTAYWSAEAWGTAYWSAEAWGTEAWGTEAWGTEAWGTELHDGAASDTR
jgi:serine protease AprX